MPVTTTRRFIRDNQDYLRRTTNYSRERVCCRFSRSCREGFGADFGRAGIRCFGGPADGVLAAIFRLDCGMGLARVGRSGAAYCRLRRGGNRFGKSGVSAERDDRAADGISLCLRVVLVYSEICMELVSRNRAGSGSLVGLLDCGICRWINVCSYSRPSTLVRARVPAKMSSLRPSCRSFFCVTGSNEHTSERRRS